MPQEELLSTMPDAIRPESERFGRNQNLLFTRRRKRRLIIVMSLIPFLLAAITLAAVISIKVKSNENAATIVTTDAIQEAGAEPDIIPIQTNATASSPVQSGPTQSSFEPGYSNDTPEIISDILLSTTSLPRIEKQSATHSVTADITISSTTEMSPASLPTKEEQTTTYSTTLSSTSEMSAKTTVTEKSSTSYSTKAEIVSYGKSGDDEQSEELNTALPTTAEQISHSTSAATVTSLPPKEEQATTYSTTLSSTSTISAKTTVTEKSSTSYSTKAETVSSSKTVEDEQPEELNTTLPTVAEQSSYSTSAATLTSLPPKEEQAATYSTTLSSTSTISVQTTVTEKSSTSYSTKAETVSSTKSVDEEQPEESNTTLPTIAEQSSHSTSAAIVSSTENADKLLVTTPFSDPFPYPVPAFRYREFSQLDEAAQNIAMSQLHYRAVTWNAHGGHIFASIERKGWMELDIDEQDGARKLGFDEDTWDCFINHYTSYTWDELPENAKQSYRAFGWTHDRWEKKKNPSSDSKWWHQLTNDERSAGKGICFFEDNWNSIDMNPNPSYFPYPVPEFRYVPWSELRFATRRTAKEMMDYTEKSWNDFRSSNVEADTFYNMDPKERIGAEQLGYYPQMWNCHIHHYDSWYWESLFGKYRIAIEALGWTKDSWDKDDTHEPDSESKFWVELTPEERAGATMLCYFRETWDGEDMTKWYDFEQGVNTATSLHGPIPEGINMSIFEELEWHEII